MTEDNPTYQDVAESSDQMHDACLVFEVARRKVYKHLNWNYSLPTPERSLRREGLIWTQVFGECHQCHMGHIKLSKKAYYMWHAYHKNAK